VPDGDLDRAMIYIEDAAREGPVNLSTPRDMATYFTRLSNGKLVSRQASAEIMGILSHQAINDRIPVLLPGGASIAHKPGNLPGATHDVGIIQTPQGPIILAALVEDAWDKDRTNEIIQRIALAAYGDYDLPPLDV
jgi:beta-lactamase class A